MDTNRKNDAGKRSGALLLSGITLMGVLASGAGAAGSASTVTAKLRPDLTIVVDGTARDFYNAQAAEVHPIVYAGTTYLPLRAIGELMGKNVNWDQSALTVTLGGVRETGKVSGIPDDTARQQDVSAELRPDFTIVVDGVKRAFTDATGAEVYPLLYDGTTYLPIRAVGGLMGSAVDWNGDTGTVTLTAGLAGGLVTDADSFAQSGVVAVPPGAATSRPDTVIPAETAKAKALTHAGLDASQVTFVHSELDREDGRLVYDVEFYTKDHKEYDYEIDAYTGEILSYDYDAEGYTPPPAETHAGSYIGETKAKSIALAQVPGASEGNVVKVKLDHDDGRMEYDVKIIYKSMEYEFEIDAYSGTILSRDVESIYD